MWQEINLSLYEQSVRETATHGGLLLHEIPAIVYPTFDGT